MPLPIIPACDLIALALVPGAGRKVIHIAIRMAERLQCPLASFFGAPVGDLLTRTAQGEEIAAAPLSACGELQVTRAHYLLELAAQWDVRHWTCQSPEFPAALGATLGTQAPPFLFYQGNSSLIGDLGAAIVGTRRPSLEGRDWARKAATLFAEEGVTVISGSATGIDTEAHRAALRADGNTVHVLPEGLHTHHASALMKKGVAAGRVLLLSEFLPTAPWATPQAITRNRTIAACSRLGCIIEPGAKGGSMYTAEQFLAQRKPVFYWGGACREGYLHDEAGAHPLGSRYGELHRDALLSALIPPPVAPEQGDLFS